MGKTLGEAFPEEMTRVRELVRLYDEIPAGVFAATLMRNALARAEKAQAAGDVAEMCRVYVELQDFE